MEGAAVMCACDERSRYPDIANCKLQIAKSKLPNPKFAICILQFAFCNLFAAAGLTTLIVGTSVVAKPSVLVVVGAPGEAEFAERFHAWVENWRVAAKKADADFQLIGDGATKASDREQLHDLLTKAASEKSSPLWLVLIGHGTFDGQSAKFNLRGSDVTAEELAKWLAPVERPLAVINCAAASAPFLNRLAKENRVIITATRSGDEQNFAHFGRFISTTIADPRADVDKDGQASLLEAYLTACRDLDEFYKQAARLPTEHALLDDNGDGLGTPAAWFRGIRATQRAKEGAALDGARAHQFHLIASDRENLLPPDTRQRRDKLELVIASLREEKPRLNEDEYYSRLEKLMLELAQLYEPKKQR
jgi:hypothetical protein